MGCWSGDGRSSAICFSLRHFFDLRAKKSPLYREVLTQDCEGKHKCLIRKRSHGNHKYNLRSQQSHLSPFHHEWNCPPYHYTILYFKIIHPLLYSITVIQPPTHKTKKELPKIPIHHHLQPHSIPRLYSSRAPRRSSRHPNRSHHQPCSFLR
jgi:hypothetical protein